MTESHHDAAPCCRLCRGPQTYVIDCAGRRYHRCRHCALVFLDRDLLLPAADERAIYDLHRNEVDDPAYRAFLSRAFGQVLARQAPPAHGLDFGCGPGPALAAMAREAGYAIDVYDIFFADDPAVFSRRYDFITCTEVLEHLAEPRSELERLWSMLKPGGPLVVQTQRVLDDERFRRWRYRADPTHISFFSERSFEWLAARWRAGLSFPHKDVAVLEKPAAAAGC